MSASESAAGYSFARVHHVQLSIPPGGEDASRAFWRDALGMRELTKPPVLAARGGCWFSGDGVEVHVGVEAQFAPARKAHPAEWDDDFPGYDRFYAHDPFGNRIEFLEPESGA